MRSVTTKPPTTLMVPRVTAISASTMRSGPSTLAATSSADHDDPVDGVRPPLISGVWSMVGTLETTS